jgi:phosphoribosyl-ATP pyrophosphohydrolase
MALEQPTIRHIGKTIMSAMNGTGGPQRYPNSDSNDVSSTGEDASKLRSIESLRKTLEAVARGVTSDRLDSLIRREPSVESAPENLIELLFQIDKSVTRLSESRSYYRPNFDLYSLEQRIFERVRDNTSDSYTSKLESMGLIKSIEKLGEESVELIVAAATKGRQELVNEASDLIYHLLVVMFIRNVSVGEVMDELYSRTNISGIEEKRSRPRDE